MSLSVVCLTDYPAPLVNAIFRQLRQVADEIVLAVDSRINSARLGQYAKWADRLLRYEYTNNPQRAAAWLHRQCRGEWILRLDGDEVPSPALVAALPELTVRRDVLQYWLPRRWLFPDSGGWLNELPWFPDYQNRLVHNDGTLWFEGTPHTSTCESLPARYVEAPLYHLNLLMLTAQERAAKARHYENKRPGLRAPGGGSVNRFYLPEQYAQMVPATVPDNDRAVIREVLEAVDEPSSSLTEIPLIPCNETDRCWNGRQPPPEAYRARLEPLERDHRMIAGEGRRIHLRIANLGVETWPWGSQQLPEIRVSYRWRAPDGTLRVAEGLRTPFPCAVSPGEQVIVPVGVMPPDEPGDYILEFDLVHELVRWFDCQLQLKMRVLPSDTGRDQFE
jgi:hypothetical protein